MWKEPINCRDNSMLNYKKKKKKSNSKTKFKSDFVLGKN